MKRYLLAAVFAGFLLMALGTVLLVYNISTRTADDGDPADVHAQKGAVYLQQHLYRAAIEEFEAATRKSPGALDPWVGLAAVYIRLGDGPRAVQDAGKAVAIAKDSAVAQILLGRAHWLAGNIGEVEQAGLRAKALDELSLPAAELLLSVYFQKHDQGKFEKIFDSVERPNRAIHDLAVQFAVRRGEFRKAYDLRSEFDRRDLEGETLRTELAIQREPNRIDLYPVLIRDQIRLGRHSAALATRSAYSGNVSLDFEMGKAYSLSGNRDEAIRSYERASAASYHKLSAEVALAAVTGDRRHWREAFRAERIEKDYFVLAQLEDLLKTAEPLDKAFIYRYAALFDSELYEQAEVHAREVLRTEPDQFDALMILGTAYARLNRNEDAMRYVQQAADRYPDRAEVWSRLGQLQLFKGNTEAAAPLMEKAVSLEPSNPSYLYNYAWLLDQLDRDRDAIPFYERAIASSSLSHEAMNNLALLQSANAVALLTRAVTSNPENDAAYMNRGNYYAAQHKWQDALADYSRAAELNPLNGLAFVESARIHLELNRADIAIEELNAALDTNAHLREAYSLLSAAYKKKGRERESAAALEEAKRIKDPQ